jgi:hypothetical protein
MRYDLEEDAAMAHLRRSSQDQNRKLYDLALEMAGAAENGHRVG